MGRGIQYLVKKSCCLHTAAKTFTFLNCPKNTENIHILYSFVYDVILALFPAKLFKKRNGSKSKPLFFLCVVKVLVPKVEKLVLENKYCECYRRMTPEIDG